MTKGSISITDNLDVIPHCKILGMPSNVYVMTYDPIALVS